MRDQIVGLICLDMIALAGTRWEMFDASLQLNYD